MINAISFIGCLERDVLKYVYIVNFIVFHYLVINTTLQINKKLIRRYIKKKNNDKTHHK